MSRNRSKASKAQSKLPGNQLSPAADRGWWPDPVLPDVAIWIGLVVSIFVVYAQVSHFEFINYDDPYVSGSREVQQGLTPESISWAFTAVVAGNRVPVTLLSHLLDGQLFHMESGMHHVMNVVYHALSAVLLFMVLRRATGARWPSAFVAFMFALHPLHVGSVAWIAERKDVLSAFFFFLAVYCYVLYTERPGLSRYLAMAVSLLLGLMSKPMLVTFPFVLLLFDFWPLRRVQWPRILWEKLPLFALAAMSSAATYFVQKATGSVDEAIPLAARMENALISYVIYIRQTIWPARLAIFYPHPKSIAAWQVAASLAIILGVSALVLFAWRTRPYLAVGWFWYLGTLVPVIGLIQVGLQSHADRYTYIPMVGLSIMLAWGGADFVAKWPQTKRAIAAAAVVSCVVWMAAAWKEAAYWENSGTIFQRAIEVTGNNSLAEGHLGHYLMSTPGRASEAIPHFEASIRIKPDDADVENDLGGCLMIIGRNADAIPHLEAALRIKPDLADAHFNLGLALSHTGRAQDAMAQYEAALSLRPDNELAHNNLGLLLAKSGHVEAAIPHFEAAVRLNPDYSSEYNLGYALLTVPGRQAEGLGHLEVAQRIHPDPEVAKTIESLRQR